MKANTNRSVLDGLPVRNWQETSVYEALVIVPSGKKHDSGYHLIALVGVRNAELVEIAAYCDDIEIKVPEPAETYGPNKEYSLDTFRCDMSYPSGIAHWWGAEFTVGTALSSTVITIRPRRKK